MCPDVSAQMLVTDSWSVSQYLSLKPTIQYGTDNLIKHGGLRWMQVTSKQFWKVRSAIDSQSPKTKLQFGIVTYRKYQIVWDKMAKEKKVDSKNGGQMISSEQLVPTK